MCDEIWEAKLIKGIHKSISVRQISALQFKMSARKGCQLYMVHVENNKQKTEKENLDTLPIIN